METTSSHPPAPAIRHPFVFTVLEVPFGIVTGYSQITLAYLATRHGLTVQDGAELVAIGYLPQIWKFFWAPIADGTWNRHRWYVVSAFCCAVSILGTAVIPLGPATLGWVKAMVFIGSLASTFLGFSVEAMMAHTTQAKERGRVSGWYQAGNLGGTGIGGGLALWLLEVTRGWETGAIVGGLIMACALVLPLVPPIPADNFGRSPLAMTCQTGLELWKLVCSREGAICMLLCFLPLGTGASISVLAQADIAALWHVGAGTVALTQGFLGGFVSMLGCLAGGYLCMRIGGRNGYAAYGGLMALVALAIGLGPRTPLVYVAGSLIYQFVNGLCYAAFSTFVLDAIGTKLAATKYNGFASLSNTPTWYLGLVLAAAETRFGALGMLLTEFLAGVLGLIIFAAVLRTWKPAEAAPQTQPEAAA